MDSIGIGFFTCYCTATSFPQRYRQDGNWILQQILAE
jgi:hypothetical protein